MCRRVPRRRSRPGASPQPSVRVTRLTTPEPLRVLLIDDQDLFRTGMRALYAEEGFEVADAANGAAALRRLGGMRPHVVVMDLNMPGISGFQATRESSADRPAPPSSC